MNQNMNAIHNINAHFAFKINFLLTICLLLNISNAAIGQDNCDCQPINEVNICFLDRVAFCGSNPSTNCGITLNHPLQEESIAEKLTNPNNFGPNGLVPCGMNIIPLTELKNVDDITNNNCNVLYVGNFPVDTITGGLNSNKTLLSDITLGAIYDWSIECSRNLAIVPQAEARLWGYTIENLNQNPNSALGGSNPIFSIFNGPFGTVQNFNQGGSYQGVITNTPSTGHIELAFDAINQPTIAFDFVSADLIIGDIGYFSKPGGGSLSNGGSVINNNDRLACNTFALACQLVGELLFESRNATICQGDPYILPNGELIFEEGNYIDTIFSEIECDTIINTQITFGSSSEDIIYRGCSGDSFSVQVGTETYNELNPSGTETFASYTGCDSVINIDLIYEDFGAIDFNMELCANDFETSFIINGNIYDISNTTGIEYLVTSNGCDSIIYIDLQYVLEPSYSLIENIICENDNETFIINGNTYDANNPTGIEIIGDNVGCDSIVEINLTVLKETYFSYQVELCDNSESSILINGNSYNIETPNGIEVIPNSDGCDSIIEITITPIQTTYTAIDTSICENENFQITINENIYDLDNPFGEELFTNYLGCDSIVTINIIETKLDTQFLDLEICSDSNYQINGETYYIDDEFVEIEKNNGQCDQVNIYRIVLFENEEQDFDTTLLIDNLSYPKLNLNLDNFTTIYWTPAEGLSCQNCTAPTIAYANEVNDYIAEVVDTNFCTYNINVHLDYIAHPSIPNIFAPNGSSSNRYFKIFLPEVSYSNSIEVIDLMIFDRWGNLVQSIPREIITDELILWDGDFNGSPAQQGVYVYTFKLKHSDNFIYNYVGDLTLLK